MLAAGAHAEAPFEEDEGHGNHGGRDEAQQADGPGTGEILDSY